MFEPEAVEALKALLAPGAVELRLPRLHTWLDEVYLTNRVMGNLSHMVVRQNSYPVPDLLAFGRLLSDLITAGQRVMAPAFGHRVRAKDKTIASQHYLKIALVNRWVLETQLAPVKLRGSALRAEGLHYIRELPKHTCIVDDLTFFSQPENKGRARHRRCVLGTGTIGERHGFVW